MWIERLHTQIEYEYVKHGWNRTGFRKYFREQCNDVEDYDKEYLLDGLKGIQPDLWRHFKGTLHGINVSDYVNVFDFAEVVVSNDLNENKIELYYNLWTMFDATDNCAMALRRIDDTGSMITIMGNSPFEDEVFGRRNHYKNSNTDPELMCDFFGWHKPKWMQKC